MANTKKVEINEANLVDLIEGIVTEVLAEEKSKWLQEQKETVEKLVEERAQERAQVLYEERLNQLIESANTDQ